MIYYSWNGTVENADTSALNSYTICDGASIPSVNTSGVTLNLKVAYQSETANVQSVVIDYS